MQPRVRCRWQVPILITRVMRDIARVHQRLPNRIKERASRIISRPFLHITHNLRKVPSPRCGQLLIPGLDDPAALTDSVFIAFLVICALRLVEDLCRVAHIR